MNGAVLVPQVKDGGLSIITAMVKSVMSGYPGGYFHPIFCKPQMAYFLADVFQEWCEQYGVIYHLNLGSDDMVRYTVAPLIYAY